MKEKAKTRPEKQIARRLPAGSGVLAAVTKGKDYSSAKNGTICDTAQDMKTITCHCFL